MRSIIVGAVALAGVAALYGCAGNGTGTAAAPAASVAPTPSAAVSTEATSAPVKEAATKTATKTPTKTAKPAKADVSQLKKLGITLDEGVLIDVADDGVDRFLAIGKDGVDFTGTTKTDATMMSLKAAPGGRKNQVLIVPPFWNEDLGDGSCVADTAGAALKLETCATGKPAQIWTVVPAGDSGQFELRGTYGIIRVEDGRITTGASGRTGLQTITFAK
ncbi:hypothetical protein [Paractinoplanes durhamensis]|uniref:Ricin B lectin domain-containing protein n=1 Tax=Paractinoplanes durhamensis TaxID=113563 RepID=A0ABQ3YWK0_9ACTN|nr:hypothetical protein [Actinoplanes durhamensis]GIE01969.1 hypothetical protein Adu01nite_33190 [Actinoplanes durhamensis]